MSQGKWWSWYAYEDDYAHAMHVKGRNHKTGVRVIALHPYKNLIPRFESLLIFEEGFINFL